MCVRGVNGQPFATGHAGSFPDDKAVEGAFAPPPSSAMDTAHLRGGVHHPTAVSGMKRSFASSNEVNAPPLPAANSESQPHQIGVFTEFSYKG